MDINCYLKVINLSNIDITFCAGVFVVPPQDLQVRTRLETLILDDNKLRVKSWQRLATFLAMSFNLREVSLKSCGIDDTAFLGISKVLPYVSKLTKLDMTYNRISDFSLCNPEGLIQLLTKKSCPPFEYLGFESNHITDKAAESLIIALQKSKSINRLNLSANQITDEFAIWLGRYLKTQRLERNKYLLTRIDLQHNGLTSNLKVIEKQLRENYVKKLNFNKPAQVQELTKLRKNHSVY